MSEIDRQNLWNNFGVWKKDRMPEAEDSDAFEFYCIDQVLKDYELTDEEIDAGNVGGGGDGGVDGFYFFVDNQLISKDTPDLKSAQNAELFLIQCTRTPTWDEGRVDKLSNFVTNLLDWKKLSQKRNLNPRSKAAIHLFRTRYKSIQTFDHTFKVKLVYALPTVNEPGSNLLLRIAGIEDYIKSRISLAEVEFEPWGLMKLLKRSREVAAKTVSLESVQKFTTTGKSVVCIAKITKFWQFLTNESGQIKSWMLEPNVRDYQGNNPVNQGIRKTLLTKTDEDFWWLNNGVTILADDCRISGDDILVENPEIVNGLQTSHEIHNAITINPKLKGDTRCVLVKVIVATSDECRNSIIKATNSQTTVKALSLRAMEPIHFEIEDALKLQGLFYDRRKGKYKRLRKPVASIVSMKGMSQAVLAALLQSPSEARGRPETPIKNPKEYDRIFNSSYPRDAYASCILLDRQCAHFLETRAELERDIKNDLRYHLGMMVMACVTEQSSPTPEDISRALELVKKPIQGYIFDWCLNICFDAYMTAGGTDKAAKGKPMQKALLELLTERYAKGAKEIDWSAF